MAKYKEINIRIALNEEMILKQVGKNNEKKEKSKAEPAKK